ncbi:MAG TPA: glycosyltransferase family 1 protein [Patescibacteria group bacterium]|nr:glycosyltransferase family 1 protein [Patescibacteria group bacterium]
MKIGIDASRAFQKQRTGIEEYSYQVIKHLRDELHSEEVFLYIKKGQQINFDLPANWKVKIIDYKILWTQLGLSLELLFHPVDVLFIPAHVVPIVHPRNTIVTVHGLEFEILPDCYSFWARFYMRVSVKFSCRWAKKIIAVSENTKKDLIRLYNVPEEKIEVIYEGVSNFKFSFFSFQSSLCDKILDYKPYLLFIGRLEKRKNIKGIVDAYEILKDKYKIPHKLILAGKPGFGYDDIKYKIQNIRYWDDVILPGYITEEEKLQLLSSAEIFLFPTSYEGFGLPILEAQSIGTPVVCSRVSSLPEIGNNSVIYCDSIDSKSIAESMYNLISHAEVRSDIIKKGYENLKRFSWGDCGFKVAKILANGDK